MGHILISIGVGVLLFAVYLGYIFYQSNIYQAMLNHTSTNLRIMISSPNFFYSAVAVILLLVMASIGYRLITSGTKLIALNLEKEDKSNSKRRNLND